MIDLPWHKTPSKKRYLDSSLLLEEVQKSIAQDRTPTEKLGQLCLLIAEHVLQSRYFNGYPLQWKEEMKSFAMLRCMKAMRTVDPSKCKNIFNYFTRIVWTSYLTQIARLKRHQDTFELIGNISAMSTVNQDWKKETTFDT